MKPDDFEQRLKRQPLRQIPAEWRAEILSAAHEEQPIRHSSFVICRSRLSAFSAQLSTVLWPHPRAWAGLAAVWVLILAVDFSLRDQSPLVAEKTAPPSPEMVAQLKQQRQMLAELIGVRDPHDADRAKPMAPQPRSEGTELLRVKYSRDVQAA